MAGSRIRGSGFARRIRILGSLVHTAGILILVLTNFIIDFYYGRHYELYRKERLKQMGFSEGDNSSGSFAETYTLRRENHLKSLQEREEEMRQKFVLRSGCSTGT